MKHFSRIAATALGVNPIRPSLCRANLRFDSGSGQRRCPRQGDCHSQRCRSHPLVLGRPGASSSSRDQQHPFEARNAVQVFINSPDLPPKADRRRRYNSGQSHRRGRKRHRGGSAYRWCQRHRAKRRDRCRRGARYGHVIVIGVRVIEEPTMFQDQTPCVQTGGGFCVPTNGCGPGDLGKAVWVRAI